MPPPASRSQHKTRLLSALHRSSSYRHISRHIYTNTLVFLVISHQQPGHISSLVISAVTSSVMLSLWSADPSAADWSRHHVTSVTSPGSRVTMHTNTTRHLEDLGQSVDNCQIPRANIVKLRRRVRQGQARKGHINVFKGHFRKFNFP